MAYKLAASTLAFQNMTLEDSVSLCRANGIEALEIRMNFHPWSDLTLGNMEYEKTYDYLQKKHMTVSDLGTGIRVNSYSEEALEELERCCQIANILHCQGLRIMLGFKRTRWSEKIPSIDYHGLIKWLEEADLILHQYKTEIWIETHNEYATGKMLRQLLNEREFRHIKLLWDMMHPLEAEEQPEDTLHYMKSDLVHVHIKDGLPWEDKDKSSWKYTRIGEGSIPIKDIVNLIVSTGYDGYFSLEWESAWRPELRGEGFGIADMLWQYRHYMND